MYKWCLYFRPAWYVTCSRRKQESKTNDDHSTADWTHEATRGAEEEGYRVSHESNVRRQRKELYETCAAFGYSYVVLHSGRLVALFYFSCICAEFGVR